MEGFASRIFNKADALDRTGRSDAATAKALYASSIFFEVLRQFGDLAPEHAAKQKYAAWRAAEIRAAVKEGRPSLGTTPSPPPGLRAPILTDLPGTPSASGLPICAVVDAQTAAKIAASALSFDDVPTAVVHLRKALQALRAA